MSQTRSKRTSCSLTHLFNQCLRLWHFSAPWKEKKFITHTKFSQNLSQINCLSTTGKHFEKLILRTIRRQSEERNLLEASQIDFPAYHSTTFQIMRLTGHATLHFNNKSRATAFLDIEKAFDTICYSGSPYELSELEFTASLIKLMASLTNRKFKASIEGEFSTLREIAAGVPRSSLPDPLLYNLYRLSQKSGVIFQERTEGSL
jgi:hypothetical protein